MCTEQKIPLEAFYIIISILCHMVYPISKSLHFLDDKINQKSQDLGNNRLESSEQLLVAINNEVRRWQNILSSDYNNWLFVGDN